MLIDAGYPADILRQVKRAFFDELMEAMVIERVAVLLICVPLAD